MKAFFKTLFGDWVNLGFVAILVVAELGLVHTGHTGQIAFIIPLMTMAGVSWLATR